MKKLVIAGAFAALAFFAITPASAQFAYATDTNGNLSLLDLSNGQPTLIGNHGQFLESLALRSDGTLFGASSSGNLYTINTTTAAATLVGSTGLGNVEGLAFIGSTLYAVDFNATPSLYTLNTSSAAPTFVSAAQSATGAVRAMTALDSRTMLMASDLPVAPTLRDYTITNGATNVRGTLPGTSGQFTGLSFAGPQLFGVNTAGETFLINPVTGAGTLRGTVNNVWLDLAVVPEPTTLAILGAGLVALAARRRRKA